MRLVVAMPELLFQDASFILLLFPLLAAHHFIYHDTRRNQFMLNTHTGGFDAMISTAISLPLIYW